MLHETRVPVGHFLAHAEFHKKLAQKSVTAENALRHPPALSGEVHPAVGLVHGELEPHELAYRLHHARHLHAERAGDVADLGDAPVKDYEIHRFDVVLKALGHLCRGVHFPNGLVFFIKWENFTASIASSSGIGKGAAVRTVS